MPNRNYIKGANFERSLVNSFKKDPKCVWAARIAGSHSPFDVVALFSTGDLQLIQCKTGKISNSIIQEAIKKCPAVPAVASIYISIVTPNSTFPVLK